MLRLRSVNLGQSRERLERELGHMGREQQIVLVVQDAPKGGEAMIPKECQAITSAQHKSNAKASTGSGDLMIILNGSDTRARMTEIGSLKLEDKVTAIGVRLAIALEAKGKQHKLNIFNIYIRPRATNQQLNELLKWVKHVTLNVGGLKRTIIMGDMNASNKRWDNIDRILTESKNHSNKHYLQVKESRGRAIVQFIDCHKMVCLNQGGTGPTFGAHTIDLAMAGEELTRVATLTCTTDRSHMSNKGNQHATLEVKIGEKLTNRSRPNKQRVKRVINYKQLKQEMFLESNLLCETTKMKLTRMNEQLPDRRDTMIKLLDTLTSKLYEDTKRAQDKITSTKIRNGWRKGRRRRRQGEGSSASWVKRIKAEIAKRCRQGKMCTKRTRTLIRDLKRHKNNIINTKLGISNEQDLWQRITRREEARRRSNTGRGGRNEGEEEEDIGIEIRNATDLNKIARDKFPRVDRTTSNSGGPHMEAATVEGPIGIRVREGEIEQAIREVAEKRYTSPHGIKMKTFKESLRYTSNTVNTIVELSFKLTHIPKPCQLTKGTILAKKGKKAFRIVHVSNPIAAILETIALHRLEHQLESKKLTSAYQFGFTPGIGRHELIARIIEITMTARETEESQRAKDFTVIVSMDIEGAFDNVDQEQMTRSLKRDLHNEQGLAAWLAEFIMNREIMLDYKGIKSKCRRVQKGVPQGSALGPILYNYATRNIHNEPNRINSVRDHLGIQGEFSYTELLSYADDLILVQRGYCKRALQEKIDKLVENIASIGLRVNPNKCSIMAIKRGTERRSAHKLEHKIGKTTIERVKKMRILGVTINQTLRPDKGTIREKASEGLKRLCKIYDMELVNKAAEWRILIDSILNARLTMNNTPALVMNRADRVWVDAEFAQMTKVIFNWPRNTSSRAVRVVLGQRECVEMVNLQVEMAKTGTMRNTWDLLGKLLNESERKGQACRMEHRVVPMWKGRETGRRNFGNPEDFLSEATRSRALEIRSSIRPNMIREFIERDNTSEELETGVWREIINSGITGAEESGGAWTIVPVRSAAIAIHLDEHQITLTKATKHAQYPISYFNRMAALMQLVEAKGSMCRRVLFHADDGMIKALENNRSRDWKIIRLREKMAENGWVVIRVRPRTTFQLIQEALIRIQVKGGKRAAITKTGTRGCITETQHVSTPQGREDEGRGLLGMELTISREPEVGEYIERYRLSKENNMNKDIEMIDQMSRMMKVLTGNNHEIWQAVTPNWLSGSKMLMLSGLIKSGLNGELRKGEDHCSHCGTEIQQEEPTVHRIAECPNFARQREELMRAAGRNECESMREMMLNKMASQTLLRLLTNVAIK